MKVNAMKLKQIIRLLSDETVWSPDVEIGEDPIVKAEEAFKNLLSLEILENALEFLNGKIKVPFEERDWTISQLLKHLSFIRKCQENASRVEASIAQWKKNAKTNSEVEKIPFDKRTYLQSMKSVPENLGLLEQIYPALFSGTSKSLKKKLLDVQNCIGYACTISVDVSSIAKAIGVETSSLESLLSD